MEVYYWFAFICISSVFYSLCNGFKNFYMNSNIFFKSLQNAGSLEHGNWFPVWKVILNWKNKNRGSEWHEFLRSLISKLLGKFWNLKSNPLRKQWFFQRNSIAFFTDDQDTVFSQGHAFWKKKSISEYKSTDDF